jgi:hypothetical protein
MIPSTLPTGAPCLDDAVQVQSCHSGDQKTADQKTNVVDEAEHGPQPKDSVTPNLAEGSAAKPEEPSTLNTPVVEDPISAEPFTTARITGLRSLPSLDTRNHDLPFMTLLVLMTPQAIKALKMNP